VNQSIGLRTRALGALLAGLVLGATLASAAPAPAAASVYAAALAAPGRSAQDRERDARDKPAEVLEFAGFKPGMRIADIFGGGGYYSEILASIVGPGGKVLLVNDPAYASFAAKGIAERFKDGRLAEVERRVVPNEALGLGQGTLDGALFVMSYHDLYFEDKNGFPHIDAAQFLDQVHTAIKPGGLLLIVDHSALPGTGNAPAQTLHRIDEKFAISDISSHGFKLLKTYDGLKHPEDDRLKGVFDEAIRGKTDRFVHLYRRT
jgi:predicted methyltransferase